MKAIATPTEPMGVEPGLFARASRPVAGFGFEQLFTITTAVASDEAIAIDTALPPELVPDAQALPMIGPVQIDAAQMPPGLGIIGANLEPVLTGPDGGALPVPLAAVTEGAGPKTGDGAVPAPPLGAIAPLATATGADAGLAVPQAAPILQQALDLGQAPPPETDPAISAAPQAAPGAGPTHPASSGPDLAQIQPEGLPPLPLQPKPDLPLDAAKTLPPTLGEALAQDDPAPLGEAVAPRIMPEQLGRVAQPDPDLPLDAAKTPLPPLREALAQDDPAPLREAVAPRIMPEQLARVAQPKTVLRDPKADGTAPATAAKSPLTPVLALGDSGALTIDPTPSDTAPSAAKTAQMSMPPVAMQLAKASPRGDQPDAKTLPKSMLEAAARGDAPRQDLPQSLPQQAEAQATHGPTARAPVTVPTPAPAPALPMPLPMAGMLNLRQADWGQQLVGQIERMVTSGTQRIELSLRPKNLGEIQVSLDLRGDQTQVHIVTETAAAARLLGGAEDRLAQMLDQSGYRLAGFTAQEQGPGAHGGQQGQHGQQGQSSPRRNRHAMDTTKPDDTPDASAAGPYRADRGQSPGINMLA
jgi:hypothetical protein